MTTNRFNFLNFKSMKLTTVVLQNIAQQLQPRPQTKWRKHEQQMPCAIHAFGIQNLAVLLRFAVEGTALISFNFLRNDFY